MAATLNPVLKSFWLTPARNRVLHGGRASTKTWDAAGFAVFLAQHCKIKVLATRRYQNKIAESVYTILVDQIDRFGLRDQFIINDTSIRHKLTGSEFIFYGIARNIQEIKSLEGVDILWIEEAQYLTEADWEILEPTIRKEGSQIWIIFNPGLVTDFVWKRFVVNPPPNTVVRQINYTENPFLSETMQRIIANAKAEDYEEYLHIYEGVPRNDDEMSVIKRSHLQTAIDAHIKLGITPTGSKRLGFDVADAGEDACATVASHGSLAYWSDTWRAKEDQLLVSCKRVYNRARENKERIIYDAIGVGAMAGAKFGELNTEFRTGIEYEKFFAGGSVIKPDSHYKSTGIVNKDYFANVKAQAWWLVADRLSNTYNAVVNGQKFDPADMIFISSEMPNLESLIDELATPKRDFDPAGRVKVESKKDLAKRDIDSPNLGDAFIMANLPQEFKKVSYFG